MNKLLLTTTLYFILSLSIPFKIYSQTVNLEIIADQDCYEPGDIVTLVFVTRLYIGNISGCENTSVSSAQVRDLNYDMDFIFPDGTTIYSQINSPGATTTTANNITFLFADTDVTNNITGAVNPSLDPCDDVDVSCLTTSACPPGFDPMTTTQSDWVHTAIFTIPASMTTGNLTLQAGEAFNFWFNSNPPGGATWANIGSGSEHDTIVVPIQTSCVLNTELTDFQVSSVKNKVLIDWTTQDETEIANYQIERSLNGRQFTVLSTQPPTRLTANNNYQYWDIEPFEGLQYYRLGMINYDASITYSKIVALEYNNIQPILYPNPFKDIIHIEEIPNTNASSLTNIQIYDLKGQLLLTEQLNSNNLINLEGLSIGTYIIRVISENYSFSKRIQKLN